MLTEDNIKKTTLRYLKGYYKYRPRSGETIARLDMRTASGIIADGHLSFPQEDGKTFLATFEATSKETKDEVSYKYRYGFFFWDSCVMAALITALLVWWNYYADQFRVGEIGIVNMLIAIGLVWLGIQITIAFIIRKSSKYRYIYAVQQFREYHANDQWIAIGEDVFPHSEDFAFNELKQQCIYNGFGLIKVTEELEPHFILTPARVNVFGKSRKAVDFFTQNEWGQRMTKNRYTSFFKKTLGKIPFQLPKLNWGQFFNTQANKYTESAKKYAAAYRRRMVRYRKTAYPQMLGTLIAVGFMAFIFFQELLDAKIIVQDEKKYLTEKELAQLKKVDSKPEPKDYELDTLNVAPYNEQTKSYIEGGDNDVVVRTEPRRTHIPNGKPTPNTDTTPDGNLESDSTHKKASTPSPPKMDLAQIDSLQKIGVGIYAPNAKGGFVVYDCARMFNFVGTKYLIQESTHSSIESAIERILQLTQYGIQANYLWLGCFSNVEEGYVVFVESLYSNKDEAKEIAIGYQKELKRKQIFISNLRIRALTKQE